MRSRSLFLLLVIFRRNCFRFLVYRSRIPLDLFFSNECFYIRRISAVHFCNTTGGRGRAQEFLSLTLLINLRHSFYGISMLEKFSDVDKFKHISYFHSLMKHMPCLRVPRSLMRSLKSDFIFILLL